ncbi:MAG: carbohydrate ABC transporter permease [Anaerolineae bacterium]
MSSVSDVLLAGRVGDSRWQRLRRGVRKHGLAYILLAPMVILLVAFVAIPFASLLYYGVHKTYLDGTASYVGLGNFNLLIHESRFIQNISATLVYLVGVLVISIPVAYFGAILISSNMRGGGVLRTLLLIPWILAPVVTALLFKTMLNPSSGPITILLKWIFGHPVYLTLSPAGSRLVIILHSAWRSFPLEMILLAAGMASIPPELYDAARVDGANLWQQFTRITLPLTRVSLLSAVIIISVFTIHDAEGVYALTQGGPGYATEVTGVRLFKEAFLYFNIGQASSIGIALILLAILVMIIYLRVLGTGEAT